MNRADAPAYVYCSVSLANLTYFFYQSTLPVKHRIPVSATLTRVLDGFGDPHAHACLSIRKLGNGLYECRTGLAWRLVFLAQKGVLTFDFAGNHDEVRAYLRDHR